MFVLLFVFVPRVKQVFTSMCSVCVCVFMGKYSVVCFYVTNLSDRQSAGLGMHTYVCRYERVLRDIRLTEEQQGVKELLLA